MKQAGKSLEPDPLASRETDVARVESRDAPFARREGEIALQSRQRMWEARCLHGRRDERDKGDAEDEGRDFGPVRIIDVEGFESDDVLEAKARGNSDELTMAD